MLIFDLIMGSAGLLLAGHSLAKKWYGLFVLEIIAGLYFLIAAIGSVIQ